MRKLFASVGVLFSLVPATLIVAMAPALAVAASADVSVVKTGPASAAADTNITYTITVHNDGPDSAASYSLSDTLPPQTSLVSIVQNSGPPTGTALASGETAVFTIVVHIAPGTAPGTVLHNSAHAGSSTPDPNAANNDASADTTVVLSADVSLTKVGPLEAPPDTDITYTITVHNNGPASAASYSLSDTLPPQTSLVSIVQNSGPPTGSALANGDTAVFTLVVHIAPGTAPGTVLHNSAHAGSSTPDSNAANNDASADTTVKAQPTITTAATSTDLGGSITDTATLAGGTNPTSSITFLAYGPNASACVGTPAFSSNVPVNGNGQYVSAAFTPAAPGTYLWSATYLGDANNSMAFGTCPSAPETSFVGGGETVTVMATQPTAFEGGSQGELTFTRSGASNAASLSISFSTSGTATSGVDYDPLGVVTIPAGQNSVTRPVHALTDAVTDDGETVIVALQSTAEYTIGSPSQATVTIREAGGSPRFCESAPISGYGDRTDAGVHTRNVDCITWYGFAIGFADNNYRPGIPVTRAQMASFVTRMLKKAGVVLPGNPPDAFPSDDGNVHELAINQLAALGVLDGTTGERGSSYGAANPMRRDDMAKLLFNSFELITGAPLPAGPNAFTDDTDGGNPHAAGTDDEAAINALAQAGVVQGTGGGLYNPTGSVTRGQFASFFVRLMQILVDSGDLPATP
jgi:uncharacterized repeat protein (TIGR01451 family)